MSNTRIILSLFLTYFVFAILLNSVGTVILQVINNYDVSKTSASVLEGFKDIPIAIVSFLTASFLSRLGFRNSMMIGLCIVTIACISMPIIPAFLTTKMLFLAVGVAFALVKVSIYSTIGLITNGKRQHASLMNTVEGVFMLGVLAGYWLFSMFIDSSDLKSSSWLEVYWWIAALCIINIIFIAISPLDESEAKLPDSNIKSDFVNMIKLVTRPLVYVFVISAFTYVLIEQGLGTWLPTFNQEVLHLPSAMSVQATSIFAASLAIGRFSAGAIMRRWSWYPILNICIIAMAILVLLTMPLTKDIVANPDLNWSNVPIAAYIFPLIGLFLAPIYPAISSVVLSSLPKQTHAAMTGLIVIFSALGGTTGSIIVGYIFGNFSGQTAFYMSLIPMTVILIALFFFKRATEKIEDK